MRAPDVESQAEPCPAAAGQPPRPLPNSAGNIADKDVALLMVGETQHEIDPVVAARAVRKTDWFLIPAMTFGYGLVYYDKAILGSAALFGMTGDLALSVSVPGSPTGAVDTSRLSWATSLFYFGMLAGLYPMSYALQRLDLGRVLGVVVCVWAVVCGATAGVTTYQGLYVQRFFLGFVESIIPTGFMTIISGFYTQREQSLRQSWWFSATGLWTIIGGGLNYGFAQIGTSGGLRRWQYIYILAGALTFVFGLMCFAMPASPVTAWFLTDAERFAAVERLRHGQTGVRCTRFKMSQLREAVLDVKIWLIFIMMASAYTVNGAVSGFGPLIVSTFGWSTLESILFQFPLGGLCWILILLTGWLGSRYENIRIAMLVVCCLPVMAGCAIIWRSEWTYHAAAPVVGYTITGTFGAVVSLIITIGMSNVAGHTKKSFTSATIFVAYCVGNIVGPQMIKSQTKIYHYPELWLGLIICYCITVISSIALYFVLRRENRLKDEAVAVAAATVTAGDGRGGPASQDDTERAKLAFLDLTDKQNPYFRYVM
ncbi:MFS transporter ACS family allantoate permease [Microdochium nivale]|nr:MFS transporter ACS family allantoate permease [Microdochium nivale]